MNQYFDSTLLKPEATESQIRALCAEAREYQFATVCVNPCYVMLAASELAGSEVGIATVIGFPLGASTIQMKVAETADAIVNGATEIDMVMNIGAFKSGNEDLVRRDIAAVVLAAADHPVKVILETCLLTDDEIIRACRIAKDAGAAFVKTSTGFNSGGATVEAVSLMRRTVGPDMGVKAAGGIRDLATARAMIEAGATRLGCSACRKIMEELANA